MRRYLRLGKTSGFVIFLAAIPYLTPVTDNVLIIITIFLHENVVACSEGNTDEDKEKIGNGKIQDQQVRCVLHLRICMNLQQIKSSLFLLLNVCLLAYLVTTYFPGETLITYLMAHESDFHTRIFGPSVE